jgi:hypothetical protein
MLRLCYCRDCQPSKLINKRTMGIHLKADIVHLNSGEYSELYIDEILKGIEKTRESLADFHAGVSNLLS